MDGWMDGWRRPNHMRSHLDALLTPTPVNFRRLWRELHGFAKQAQFETPSVRVPSWFWRDFGRFLEVRKGVKIYFPTTEGTKRLKKGDFV